MHTDKDTHGDTDTHGWTADANTSAICIPGVLAAVPVYMTAGHPGETKGSVLLME